MTSIPPIADAHVHFWDLERNRYPWLEPAEPSGPFGQTASIRKTYLLADYRTDVAGQDVTRMVHVEAGWDRGDPLGEMRWIQGVADRFGAPHAHVAHIDLASSGAAGRIREHGAFPLFRGVRDRLQDGDFTGADGSGTRIDDPAWLLGMKLLDAAGLSFDLQCPPALVGKACALTRRFEGVSFVLTHAGYPPAARSDQFDRWRDGLALLAERPNVVVKLSGLALAEKAWRPSHAQKAADVLLDVFGADRVLVASNSPVDRLFAPIADVFDSYRRWIAPLSEADQAKILSGNACRVYKMEG